MHVFELPKRHLVAPHQPKLLIQPNAAPFKFPGVFPLGDTHVVPITGCIQAQLQLAFLAGCRIQTILEGLQLRHYKPFWAAIYASITAWLTFPTVAAKYERVHRDGSLSNCLYLWRSPCAVIPLHSLTISAAVVVGHATTHRWMWSGLTARSTIRQPRSRHFASSNARHSVATSPTNTALRRLGVHTK